MDKSNGRELDLRDLLRIFTKNIVVFVIAIAVFAVGGFLYGKLYVKPVYRAEVMFSVKNTLIATEQLKENYYNQTDINAASSLVAPCIDIFKSNNVTTEVSEIVGKDGLRYGAGQIRGMMSFVTEEGNPIFRMHVTGLNAADTQVIANTIAQVVPTHVQEHLGKVTVSTIDRAVTPGAPINGGSTRYALLAAVLAFVLCYAVFFLLRMFDVFIHTEEDLIELGGGKPILGSIPTMEEEGALSLKKRKTILGKRKLADQPNVPLLINENTSFFVREAYKDMRTNIVFSSSETGCRIIAFTSSSMHEGKSTTCLNTAISFAEMGKKVLIIDTDMRKPRIHRLMKCGSTPGLSDLLVGETNFKDCVFSSRWENLSVIFAGNIAPNPAELLSSPRMEECINELSKYYDYILVDTPAVGPVTDAVIVSRLVSGIVFIVREGMTEKPVVKSCLDKLMNAGAKLLGFVINDVDVNEEAHRRFKYRYYSEYK